VNVVLLLSSLCLVAGGLLLTVHFVSQRRPSLPVRLARTRGELPAAATTTGLAGAGVPEPVRVWSERIKAGYEQRLHLAGRNETSAQLMAKKLLLAFAVPCWCSRSRGFCCRTWCCEVRRAIGARRSSWTCRRRCR